MCLRSLSSDAAGQLHVLRHDGHSLGVDRAEVGVLEQAHEVSLSCLLEGEDGAALESELGLEFLRDLADEALEGELADEELSALLVSADLAEGDGSWAISVGLLHATGVGCRLAGALVGDCLAGCLATVALAGGMLGSGHCVSVFRKLILLISRGPACFNTWRDLNFSLSGFSLADLHFLHSFSHFSTFQSQSSLRRSTASFW